MTTTHTISHSALFSWVDKSKRGEVSILSMTPVRCGYEILVREEKQILADASYGGGDSANPRTPELDSGDCPKVASQSQFERVEAWNPNHKRGLGV